MLQKVTFIVIIKLKVLKQADKKINLLQLRNQNSRSNL